RLPAPGGTGRSSGPRGAATGDPRGDGRGGPPDLLLHVNRHRGEHSHLHAATSGRPHLRADGVDGDVGAGRFTAAVLDAGATALLRPAARAAAARREPTGPRLPAWLRAGAALGAGRAVAGARDCGPGARREPGLLPKTRHRVPTRAQR